MGRQWEPENINTSTSLDVGIYRARFKPIEEARTKPNETSPGNKLMYVATMDIMEPSAFTGLTQRDNWTIGNDEDPEAADPRTWDTAIGAKSMKKAMLAAKVPITRDLDACLAALEGQEVLIRVKHQIDKRDPSRTNVNVADYFALGQRVIGTTATNGATAGQLAVKRVVQAIVATGNATMAASQPKAVAKPTKEVMLNCPSCEWLGPKREFSAHATTHDEAEED